MNIITTTKNRFNNEIRTRAEKNIVQKLQKQGISRSDLHEMEFEELVRDEIKILENDAKKIGLGIGIGIAFSLLTGI